jgi:hypothetical protein
VHLVRLNVARNLMSFAWEVALLEDLRNAVAWRAAPEVMSDAPRATAGQHLEGRIDPAVANAWTLGTGEPPGAILGMVHVLGRPRRALSAIDLQLASGALWNVEALDGVDVVLQLARQASDHASAATRTEIGILRELAASLIERGARSVIVLPAIAVGDVNHVVVDLAVALGAAPARSLARLAAGVRACRTALAHLPGEHAAIADEVTLLLASPLAPLAA